MAGLVQTNFFGWTLVSFWQFPHSSPLPPPPPPPFFLFFLLSPFRHRPTFLVGGAVGLCGFLSVFLPLDWLLCFSPRLWGSCSLQADLISWVASQGADCLPLSQLPLRSVGLVLIPFFPVFFFFHFMLPSYVEGFLPFSEVWVLLPTFSRCSVWLFYM